MTQSPDGNFKIETTDFTRTVAILTPEIAGKIAAGECVERPASVVKELVENSLDAGATRITVEMEDGGRSLIRITDNGKGMSRDDMVLSVQRHATSKLRFMEDLDQILTLGFRGEALPSIAAVSRLEIVSSMEGSDPNRLVMEGSEITELTACGAPPGTTVIVQDLFFNTPARLKFLRSSQTEFSHALEHLTRLAIAHHTVAFRVVHNGRESLNTPGSADPLNAIVAAYGADTATNMVPVNLTNCPISVYGYVSRPSLTRANRLQQSFFVNRRWVRNRTIGHGMDQAYRTLLTVGRHPIAAILIEMPPELVDVNVHPTKAEVRFVRDGEIHQAVNRAVKDALMATSLVPEADMQRRSYSQTVSDEPDSSPFIQHPLWIPEKLFQSPTYETTPGVSGSQNDALNRVIQDRFQAATSGESPANTDGVNFRAESDVPTTDSWFPNSEHSATVSNSAREPVLRPVSGPLATARVVGQLHLCYIVADTSDGILLIDQHAAHERILYEKFLRRGGPEAIQQLIVPITLSLGRQESAMVLDRLEDFRALGFEMDSFGPNTFLVRTTPIFQRPQNCEQLLMDLVDEMEGSEFGRKVRMERERIAASMACRSAVKQGDLLSRIEMEALVDDLRSVENPLEVPTNCPHGRPTTILLTINQIERLFKRQ